MALVHRRVLYGVPIHCISWLSFTDEYSTAYLSTVFRDSRSQTSTLRRTYPLYFVTLVHRRVLYGVPIHCISWLSFTDEYSTAYLSTVFRGSRSQTSTLRRTYPLYFVALVHRLVLYGVPIHCISWLSFTDEYSTAYLSTVFRGSRSQTSTLRRTYPLYFVTLVHRRVLYGVPIHCISWLSFTDEYSTAYLSTVFRGSRSQTSTLRRTYPLYFVALVHRRVLYGVPIHCIS